MTKPQKNQANHTENNNGQVVSAQWAGPLPPPNVLASFNDVIENGAERIVAMAEREQAHRISYENAEQSAIKDDFKRGQYIGGALALVCVAASVFSVYLGAHPTVSIALVSLPITALIGKMLKR